MNKWVLTFMLGCMVGATLAPGWAANDEWMVLWGAGARAGAQAVDWHKMGTAFYLETDNLDLIIHHNGDTVHIPWNSVDQARLWTIDKKHLILNRSQDL